MIRHVAMFTWHDDASSEQIRGFADQLATMPSAISLIRRYEHGDDLQLGPGTADYVLVADFDTVEDYQSYAKDPYHLEFIERHVKPLLGSISRVQYHLP